MNIHQIINARSWADTRYFRERFGLDIKQDPLNIVSVRLKAEQYLKDYLRAPEYYCHDCSSEYRRPVYHRQAPTPHDRLNKFKRSTLLMCEELNSIIETEYPYFI